MKYSILDSEGFERNRDRLLELLVQLFVKSRNLSNVDAERVAEIKSVAMKEHIDDGSAYIVAACEDTELLGFAWFYQYGFADEERFHLTEICVDEAYRNSGLGKSMIEIGIDEAKRRGLNKVDLFVNGSNEEAAASFESMGFEKERTHFSMDI